MCFVPVNNTATVIQIYKVYLSLHICCLIFLIFLSFWMLFPPMSCFSLLFLWKAIIGSSEKVFSQALLVFRRWTSDFQLFVLYWEVCDYMSLSGVTLGVSVLFLSTSLIFLILISIKDE